MIAALPYPYQIEARHELQESELFLIRVWRPIVGGFRASVRGVGEEQAHLFTAADQVARFLEQVEPLAQDGTNPPQRPFNEAP